ncbi:MAG: hypothetical protein ACE5ES_02740 [Candidatus Nanoarchaeia archaeon]
MKSKKGIKKSIESFDKLIEEHKEKIEKFGHEQSWLKDYWEKQIEEFEKQKEKEEKKLEE